MELTLRRIARKKDYTIGKLYLDGEYFCDTLEDEDRGLAQSLPQSVNKVKKVAGKTAIPTGKYQITLSVRSPRFGAKKQYAFCEGRLPRLINVPAFQGVLIHIGNTPADTEGCILVGQNKQKGMVLNSTATFHKLYDKLKESDDLIFITIK